MKITSQYFSHLSDAEITEKWGVSRTTIWRARKRGWFTIPYYRLPYQQIELSQKEYDTYRGFVSYFFFCLTAEKISDYNIDDVFHYAIEWSMKRASEYESVKDAILRGIQCGVRNFIQCNINFLEHSDTEKLKPLSTFRVENEYGNFIFQKLDDGVVRNQQKKTLKKTIQGLEKFKCTDITYDGAKYRVTRLN